MPRLISELVGPDADGMRLDAFLAALDGAPSRSACVRLIEDGAVTINSTLADDKSERLALGDRVEALVPEAESEGGPLRPNPDIELDIRYEDEQLIILSKQAGLVCHPSPGHVDDTLANALVAHCGYEHLGMLQGEERPGIVHRLDMDTTGLMLAAKTDEAQQALQDQIRMRSLDRRYIALLQGPIALDEGTVTTGIARSKRDPLRMCVSNEPDAREAITDYRVLERFEAGSRDEGYTLVECHLWTGRTHQIRVHARHIGHPCVGDPLYGLRDERRNLGLSRQFLHSWRVELAHPMTGEELLLKDRLPEDLASVLASLEERSQGRTAAGDDIVPELLGL